MTLLIDVRTPFEFMQGHLDGAINIEYQFIHQEIALLNADLSCRIYVYCKSGQRSEFAKQMLLNLGYVNVENIGGYEALKSIDFNIVYKI